MLLFALQQRSSGAALVGKDESEKKESAKVAQIVLKAQTGRIWTIPLRQSVHKINPTTTVNQQPNKAKVSLVKIKILN